MMLWRVATYLVWLGVLGLGTGCSFYQVWFPYQHQASFNEADYAPYAIDGTAVIKGEAVATLKDGKTIKAVGELVYLIPATAYSREWFEHAILAGHRIEGIDPRSLRVTRTTSTDMEGRFTFINVPQGDYYLTCTVTWTVPSFTVRTMEIKRAGASTLVHATVRVGPDNQVSVRVTGQAS